MSTQGFSHSPLYINEAKGARRVNQNKCDKIPSQYGFIGICIVLFETLHYKHFTLKSIEGRYGSSMP